MGESRNVVEAHKRVQQFACELAESDFEVTDILDALTLVGINAGVNASGREPVIAFLKKVVAALESGGPVGRMN